MLQIHRLARLFHRYPQVPNAVVRAAGPVTHDRSVPRLAHRPKSLRRRIFRGRDALSAGLLTPAQLRSSIWQRVIRGVYSDAALPLDHGLKARAAALLVPPDAAITGVSAAWLWGARLAPLTAPVDVVRPPGRRLGVTAELRMRNAPLPAADVDELAGVRITTPLRTAWELALRLDLIEAVTYCDALAARGKIDKAALTGYLRAHAGRHGCRAARRVFDLIDGRSESPQESRLRVHLVLAGIPTPTPQHEVRVRGQFVARVDLAWPEVKLGVEYDGIWHANADQLIRDRARLNRLHAEGWHIHHVTISDMRDIPATVEAIGRLLASRGRPS